MDIWMKLLYCVMFHELRCDHFRFLTDYRMIFFIIQSLSLLTWVESNLDHSIGFFMYIATYYFPDNEILTFLGGI